MICDVCKKRAHSLCRGCTCQHRNIIERPDVTCPVHHVNDGYAPVMPEGTLARSYEDLEHAGQVFMQAVLGLFWKK